MNLKSRGAQRRRLAALISSVENLEQRRLLSDSTVNYSSGTYTQNFDSLANGTTTVGAAANPMDLSSSAYLVSGAPAGSMQGWNAMTAPYVAGGPYVWNATSGSTPRFSADNGTSTTGSLYSYGVTNATNRALGSLGSGSSVPGYGVEMINTSGAPISAITISYTGETFHIGDSNVAYENTLYFGYEIGNTGAVSISDSDSSYTAVPSLYYGPITTTTGNDAPSSTPAGTPLASLTQTITQTVPVSWGAGQVLILRWHDYNETGNDYGLAIDNFTFTQAPAVPGTINFDSSGFSGTEPTNGAGNNASFVNFKIDRNIGTLGNAILDYSIPNTGTATEGATGYLPPAAVAATGSSGAISAGTVDGSGNITGTLTFLSGQTSATISVPIADDSIPEPTETFTMTISKDASDTSGFTLGTPSSATGSIYDNDGTAQSGILLNELDVNPPGDGTAGHSDGPNEYVEIINTSPSAINLSNLYFVSIEGDVNSNAGDITYEYPFTGTLGAGQIGILEADSGGPTPAAGAKVFQDSEFDTASGVLQNGTNSFALMYSQIPLADGMDLDTAVNSSSTASNYPENGTLTLTGSQAVVDSVGWHDKSSTSEGDGTIYGGADLSIAGTVPGAATRIPGDNVANTASDWYDGELYTATNDPTSLTYNASYASSNFPEGGVLTPGGANYFSTNTSGQFGFTSTFANVNEDAGTIQLTVNRVAGTTDVVTVPWAITPGTATQGADYTAPTISSTGGSTSSGAGYSGTITFNSGETSATITVPIVNDSIPEPTETFNVALSTPTDVTNASNTPLLSPTSSTTVRIGDNDTKLLLNELLVNVPGEAGDTDGNDQYNEMVEILGTPGQVIPADTYFLSVEGDGVANAGELTYVLDLGGTVVGSNGLIEIRSENPASVLPPPAPGTTVIDGDSTDPTTGDPNGFNQSGGVLQNGTNSFLLMSSAEVLTASSTLEVGQSNDVDTSNDGTLDLSTLGAHLIDGVGWTDGGTGDVAYGALLNFGGFAITESLGGAEIAPAAAVRVPDTTDVPDSNPNSTASLTAASDWYYGDLVGQDTTAPAADDRLVFDPNYSGRFNFINQTFTTDPNEHLTPGELNYYTAPFVELPTSGFGGGSTNPIFNIDFSSNVSGNLSTSQLTLTNTDTSTTVSGLTLAPLTSAQAFANGYVETVNLPTNLPQGHYTMTVAAGVTDDFGLQSTASYSVNFTVLYGDANGDGKVNALDFNTLATNFGKPGNYSQGDFDYSGQVGINDFDILAANYGKTIPAPTLSTPAPIADALPNGTTPASSVAASSASLFSNEPISGSLAGDLLN